MSAKHFKRGQFRIPSIKAEILLVVSYMIWRLDNLGRLEEAKHNKHPVLD